MPHQIDIEDIAPTGQASKRMTGKSPPTPLPVSPGTPTGSCLECGSTYAPRTATQEFCCSACRRAWNNRRAVRGAELYDWFMAFRVQRIGAHFKLMCRLVTRWRDEDKAQRHGRRSWGNPQDRLDRDPSLLAEVRKV